MRAALVLSSVVMLAACGGPGASPPRDAGPLDSGTTVLPDGAITGIDAGPGADAAIGEGDAGMAVADAGMAVAAYPYCRIGCAAPADCATAGAPLYDASHYECESGLCRWTGCHDDAECQSTFSRSDYACRAIGGLMQCVQTCTGASTCGSGTAAFDADNYACSAGSCAYAGCNDDAECTATFASDRYACRPVALPDTGLPLPSAPMNCVLRCTTSADCSTPSAAFDGDNYECTAGACVYTGCNGDAECQSTFSSPRYLCR